MSTKPHPPKPTPTDGHSVPAKIRVIGSRIHVTFPYDPLRVSYVKMLAKSAGAKDFYDTKTKEWKLPHRCAADLYHLGHIEPDEKFMKLALEQNASALEEATYFERIIRRLSELNLRAPLPDGKTLMDHQRFGVDWMLQNLRVILADDMGLGKTLQALVCSKIIYEAVRIPTVIVTKASLVADWQEAARALKHPYFTVHSWAAIPEPIEGKKYCLIGDEAHMAQNLQSTRTRRFLAIAAQSLAVFCLTGTPMKNGQPKNIFPLLRAIGHPLGNNKPFFEQRFCKASVRKIKKKTGETIRFYDASGAANLEELREAIRPVILRRLKNECIDLPEKTIILRDVEPSAEMEEIYRARFQQAKDEYAARVERKEISDEGKAMAMLTYVRVAASLAKAEAAIELAEESMEQGGQVIIFTEFRESLKIICEHFKVPEYVGDTTKATRADIVRAFQAGSQKVFAATRETGGTGLTLTAGNTVILVDRPLTPGDADQAVDRAHRIGQHWPVTGYWLRAFDVCQRIDKLLIRKGENIKKVLGGTQDSVSGVGAIKASDVLRGLFTGMDYE